MNTKQSWARRVATKTLDELEVLMHHRRPMARVAAAGEVLKRALGRKRRPSLTQLNRRMDAVETKLERFLAQRARKEG